MVLVGLYTSLGGDLCPAPEEMPGAPPLTTDFGDLLDVNPRGRNKLSDCTIKQAGPPP
jgi:hypothetical protein